MAHNTKKHIFHTVNKVFMSIWSENINYLNPNKRDKEKLKTITLYTMHIKYKIKIIAL